jgi:predicted ATPase
VIVVDDFHWLDPSSRALLDELVRLCGEFPAVVLAGARPPVMPDWVSLPHVEVIHLEGLDEAETEELGVAVGGGRLEPESAHWLYKRTAGNPLFVAEIIRALRSGHRISREGGRLKIDRASARRSVPLSLRALMGARIDSLSRGPRSLLEVASVIGVVFPEWLVAELSGSEGTARGLDELAAAGILERCEGEPDDLDAGTQSGCWRFRHELFHDAAYGRLLIARKRQLHTALADRLEEADPPAGAAELARHRMAAGDAVRAVPALELAAAEAEAMGAVAEAEAFRAAARSFRDGQPLTAESR